MPLSPGTRLGVYEIVAPLGVGGMGEVHRARDSKLGRDVAIKLILDAYADDPERMSRFAREARALAAINHPRIATLYGLEEVDARHLLVMELVDGPTLEQLIDGTPLPVARAIAIATQVADGLEAAHEKGVIHRDLKPANIKVGDDDAVKILDFGLARAMDSSEETGEGRAHAPTMTSTRTQAGVILGTIAYMSPEQARGQPADARSDIFSFGCVLYEMVTGRPPFDGPTASDIMAALLTREPDWSPLPSSIPPRLTDLLRRCLAKVPRKRWQAIGDVRYELEQIAAAPLTAGSLHPGSPSRPLWRRALPVAAGVVAGALVAGALAWGSRSTTVDEGPVTRATLDVPDGPVIAIAISPDGRHLALVTAREVMTSGEANAAPELWLRDMSAFDARPVPGLQGLALGDLLFSKDGQAVYFIAGTTITGPTIKRVAVTGGVPVDVGQLPTRPYGMSWDGDALLVGLGALGIGRVPASGGPLETVVSVEPGEYAVTPVALPDGDTVLFARATGTADPRWPSSEIVARSLSSGTQRVVVSRGDNPRFLPSGHLIYAVEGVWYGVAFDQVTLRTAGLPVPLVEGVGRPVLGGLPQPQTLAALSTDGTLVYAAGDPSFSRLNELVLVDRAGQERRLDVAPGSFEGPRVSPDGRFVALSAQDGDRASVGIVDLDGRLAPRRLEQPGNNRSPVWSPDGSRIVFQSDRDGDRGLFVTPADGSGDAQRLTTAEPGTEHIPEFWSGRDQVVAYSQLKPQSAELWTCAIADRTTRRLGDVVSTSGLNARLSPDGRWIAYTLRTPTRGGVYVEPMPATGARYEVAGSGAHHPFWSPDGTELFYFQQTTPLSSRVTLTPQLTFGRPSPLPATMRSSMTRLGPNDYDITPDGRTFVWTRPVQMGDAGRGVRIVLHWFDEVRRLLPAQ